MHQAKGALVVMRGIFLDAVTCESRPISEVSPHTAQRRRIECFFLSSSSSPDAHQRRATTVPAAFSRHATRDWRVWLALARAYTTLTSTGAVMPPSGIGFSRPALAASTRTAP